MSKKRASQGEGGKNERMETKKRPYAERQSGQTEKVL